MPSEIPNSEVSASEDPMAKSTRLVTLQRSEAVISLGFSIRGGIEHGLGHFVSSVEPDSEAHRQGLRPGDEVLTVCGLPILGATHKEVVNFISSRWKLELEIRSVGAIPVKNRKGDPISWLPCHVATTGVANAKKKENGTENKKQNEIMTIQVASPNGKRSLGCSIFKGRRPEDPGIYVQTAKPGGLARRAGLRPGDQILECNGVSFANIDLAEAVVHLKSGKELDLLIRKGSHDLLTGESSGYDSSSGASANGRHSDKPKSKARVAFKTDDEDEEKSRRLAEERKLLESQMELERRRLEREQEALKKESEKLEAEKKKFEEEKRKQLLSKTNSNSSIASSREGGDSSGSEGLANALQNEIERRRRQANNNGNSPSSVNKTSNSTKNVVRADPKPFKALPAGMLKNDQHDQLMEEFRRVHRKMFSTFSSEEDGEREKEEESNNKPNFTFKREISRNEEKKETVETKPVSVEEKVVPQVSALPPKIPAEKRQQVEPALPPKCPPPPPPARSSSMTPPSSCSGSPCPPPPPPPTISCTKPDDGRSNQDSSDSDPIVGSPGIPTPDYDSSPRSSPISSRRTASDERPSARSSPPASPLSSSSITLSTASSSSSSTSSGSCTYLGPRRPSLVRHHNNNNNNNNNSHHHNSNNNSYQQQRSPSKNHWNMTTFSKRHPLLEIGSLESFSMDENGLTGRISRGLIDPKPVKPPDFYFETSKSHVRLLSSTDLEGPDPTEFEFLPRHSHNRSVRFDEGSAAAIASHDYRIAHASGKSDARHLESQLLHTLKKSGHKWESTPALSTASMSSSGGLGGLNSDAEDLQPPKRPPKSPKKHAAPPPPPPPPAVMVAKANSISSTSTTTTLKASATLKGIE